MSDFDSRITKPPLLDIHTTPVDEDPEIPFSGGSSAAFRNDDLNRSAKETIEQQKRQRNELLPVAEDLFAIIRKEIEAIGDIRSYRKTLGEKPGAKDFEAEYRARELYVEYLERFQGLLFNRLSKTSAKHAGRR